MRRGDSDGALIVGLIAAAIAIVALIYLVSGIGHLLGLTPTGSELLGGSDEPLSNRYQGVVAGYVLTLLVVAAPVAAFVVVRWWLEHRPDGLNALYATVGGPLLVLVLLVVLLPVGPRDRLATEPVIAERDRAGDQPARAAGPGAARPARGKKEKRETRPGKKIRQRTASGSGLPGIPPDAKTTTVTEVTDGDTVKLAALDSARLIGVDTPEVYFGPECYGAEASSFAKSKLTPGTTVHYVYDVEHNDRYDRDLIYLWLGTGQFFNAMLAEKGYAVTLTIPPNVEHADLFRRLVSEARQEERGLWSSSTCDGDADAPADGGGSSGGGSGGGSSGGEPGGGGAGGGAGCEPGYEPCVPSYPPDVDCADVDGPISVSGRDPHGLDADGDGTGCE